MGGRGTAVTRATNRSAAWWHFPQAGATAAALGPHSPLPAAALAVSPSRQASADRGGSRGASRRPGGGVRRLFPLGTARMRTSGAGPAAPAWGRDPRPLRGGRPRPGALVRLSQSRAPGTSWRGRFEWFAAARGGGRWARRCPFGSFSEIGRGTRPSSFRRSPTLPRPRDWRKKKTAGKVKQH